MIIKLQNPLEQGVFSLAKIIKILNKYKFVKCNGPNMEFSR